MRNGERFIWVSSLGNPRQQPDHMRTIIRKHVMRDIGRSRRKSARKDVVNIPDKVASVSRACDRRVVGQKSKEDVDHQDMVLCLCRSLFDDNTREPLSYRMPAYFDATPIRRRVHGNLWQDFYHLDHSASYQIDLMMAAYFTRFEGGSCTFDLDGPSVMTLRVKALQETQKAIEDPDRCVSLGVIAAIVSSILEAYVRGDTATCRLHLVGLRAIMTQRQRLLGVSSLYSDFKICILITTCEIICARACGITPEFPFPLSYFQTTASFGPPRSPSRFSRLVNTAWSLDPRRHKSSNSIYNSIISRPEPQMDNTPACYELISTTMFSMLFGFKQWLVSHESSDPNHISNRFVELVASSMDEILPDDAPDASSTTLPTTRLDECSGQDILKLMILVTGSGT